MEVTGLYKLVVDPSMLCNTEGTPCWCVIVLALSSWHVAMEGSYSKLKSLVSNHGVNPKCTASPLTNYHLIIHLLFLFILSTFDYSSKFTFLLIVF